LIGTVKFYIIRKNFGFITTVIDKKTRDVYFQSGDIIGTPILRSHDRVEFDYIQNNRGGMAVNITKLNGD